MENKNYLVGSAGHVDHGKTEMIRALSGIDTDRLKEEKQRGISIELGFAHMVLPSGREVGIVDVPGHERFVRQMLAGAGGMDIVLLVIAADEGIMPQTREHLDILTLLKIPRGIVVLNKIDLVDLEWLELMKEEVREGLKDTAFAEAPLCPVSAVTGEGISELKEMIDQLLNQVESKKVSGPTRMPLDRVFSIQGFGTVVTGTLYNGTVEIGQDVAIEPAHLISKVRSLQVHGQKVSSAQAGQRVAVNLAGLEVAEVEKGAVLVAPNSFQVGNILDLKVQSLSSVDKPIVQRQRLRFHLGTAEILGRIHLLDREEIAPGEEGYAQIILESPVLAAPKDRFVLRFYSPARTAAGGEVLGVAEFKQKRFKESVLAVMRLKDQGNPLDLLERELSEPKSLSEVAGQFHIALTELEEWLQELEEFKRVEVWTEDNQSLYWGKTAAEAWRVKLLEAVRGYSKAYPLRGGIGREELKSKMGVSWPHHLWQAVLELGAERGYYRLAGGKILPPEEVQVPPHLAKQVACLVARWHTSGLMPPELEMAAAECQIQRRDAGEFAQYLCDTAEWTAVNGLYFTSEALEEAKRKLFQYLQVHAEVSVAEVRELWGTSRKYTVPLLEYFDQQHITRRAGDKRVLYK
ncbi:MAG: selenocysteine-specific translation elongation factor [Desulfitobacteriaceae bacterium]